MGDSRMGFFQVAQYGVPFFHPLTQRIPLPDQIQRLQCPADGLRMLEGREVDMVISDQNMPFMTGLEFLQRVKADHPGTLTMMLTGEKEIEIAVQAINQAGVYKFILKPWDDNDLKVTIRRALESLDLVRERDKLSQRIKERDAILRNLEKAHPGITHVDKDSDGYLILE